MTTSSSLRAPTLKPISHCTVIFCKSISHNEMEYLTSVSTSYSAYLVCEVQQLFAKGRNQCMNELINKKLAGDYDRWHIQFERKELSRAVLGQMLEVLIYK